MKRNEDIGKRVLQSETMDNQVVDNRKIVLGGLSLLLLALFALVIRTVLPDLNPYFLAGVGAVTYVAYLGFTLRAEMARLEQEHQGTKPVTVEVRVDSSMAERS